MNRKEEYFYDNEDDDFFFKVSYPENIDIKQKLADKWEEIAEECGTVTLQEVLDELEAEDVTYEIISPRKAFPFDYMI